jgi:phage/plasmid primase-like uncharacterized protein
VDGKLWTVQYIKEDGTKRFAKDSRKQGCFHVIDAGERGRGFAKARKLAGDRDCGGVCDGGDGS